MNPGGEHRQLGSLTGAVSSQSVTEELKGTLSLVGNQAKSAKVGSVRLETAFKSVRAQAGFTARHTGRAVSKEGSSDPAVLCGRAVAQRIKATPGITG